jgi:lysophospholipase L1-like esterase
MLNNARVTWFPVVATALDCEYGQLGSGGQGMLKPMALPPLPQSWDRFDAAASRLTDGRLVPEPDYVFCCMGTNDFQGEGPERKQMDITAAYLAWLVSVRKACPTARVFCVTPPLGWHTREVTAAVASRNRAGDRRVYLIDTTPRRSGFGDKNAATQLAPDGCHPSVYGNAMLGALIAVEAQKVLSRAGGK